MDSDVLGQTYTQRNHETQLFPTLRPSSELRTHTYCTVHVHMVIGGDKTLRHCDCTSQTHYTSHDEPHAPQSIDIGTPTCVCAAVYLTVVVENINITDVHNI